MSLSGNEKPPVSTAKTVSKRCGMYCLELMILIGNLVDWLDKKNLKGLNTYQQQLSLYNATKFISLLNGWVRNY